MHYRSVRHANLLTRVRTRMREGGISQRGLAHELGLSQGHVSRLLRGKGKGDSRGYRALRDWLELQSGSASPGSSDGKGLTSRGYLQLVAAARAAVGDSPRVMPIAIRLMHLISELHVAARQDCREQLRKGRRR